MKGSGTILGSPAWDIVGFAGGLALAWTLDWQTRDLVWGLWLSSLIIGYTSIVLGILGGAGRLAGSGNRAGWLIGIPGGLLLLAFFSVHFGGFHFVHSVFLNSFFPIVSETKGSFGPGLEGYRTVLASYWPWLFAAAIAERDQLAKAWQGSMKNEPGRDKPHPIAKPAYEPMGAYKNVVRMHLLIFFFAGTSIAGLENFWIYAAVYAVYFFPWSFVRSWCKERNAVAEEGGQG